MLSLKEATSFVASEVIVVDNNSEDESCTMIKEHFPKVILIENKINNGFGKANNQGVTLAKGEYICFLNPDTIVPPKVFVEIIDKAERLPNAGLLGPRLINGVGDYLHESKRNIPSPLTSLRRLFGIKLGHVKNYYADHVPSTNIGDVDILVGAFMLVKKEKYLFVGAFDENYFMYGEDIDLSYRFKKMGFQNYYIGTVTAVHYRGESTDRNAVYIRRFYSAMRLFYKKHFRSNFILDFMVLIAIRLVSIVQSFKNFEKKKKEIAKYYLVSEDKDLRHRLRLKLNKKVEILRVLTKEDLGDTNIEIIFDNNFLSFKEIITQMQVMRKDNITFKIRPQDCTYIVGSNFSDGRGETILF